MSSVPPARDLASPVELTVTSTRWPGLAKGGSSAVTITAATFLTFTEDGLMVMPWRAIKFVRVCTVNLVWSLSPVPSRPTTTP